MNLSNFKENKVVIFFQESRYGPISAVFGLGLLLS